MTINTEIIGKSVEGQKIPVVANVNLHDVPSSKLTLIVGGMHGDERGPVPMLEHFVAEYVESGRVIGPVCVIPLLNPDGYDAVTRTNAHGVDLNRNFPFNWRRDSIEPPGEMPLSEPESTALYRFILQVKPLKIINLHWSLSELDADGPQSVDLAEKMWDALADTDKRKYCLKHRAVPSAPSIECPGSLGQWCGYALQYPDNTRPVMVTMELPYTIDCDRDLHPLPQDSFATVIKIWRNDFNIYMKHTEPSVHTMLEVACRE